MGANEGNYSRDMFDESKQYVGIRQQVGVPVVDADVNDADDIYRNLVRRCYQDTVGDGSPNAGFNIIEATVTANNFEIQGGDGTLDGAGVLVREGLRGIIPDVGLDYISSDKRLKPQVTGVSALVLTDSAANYIVNELAGRTLTPDVDNPGTTYTIASNTATTITVTAGDMTGDTAAKKFYRVELSTPGSPRHDVVWSDFFIDEWNSDEDTDLEHNLGSLITAALRNKLRTVVHVREGAPTLWTPSDYTDSDGRLHYTEKLASLNRIASANILNAQIVDARPPLLSMAAINAELVQSRTADARRTDGGGPNYAQLDNRLDSMDDEICDARGSTSFLATRLAVALQADGNVKSSYITSAMILNNEILDADINSSAAIQQTKSAASASVNDSFAGATTTLEDDLNEIRTKIKDLKGTANWDTAVTDTLEGVVGEVQTARGSQADLDTRLDVSLNEDGTLKALGISGALPRLASEQPLIMQPQDAGWNTVYRLHGFRGYLKGDYASGNPPTIFVDYNVSHSAYPLDVTFGGGAGPGGRDNKASSGIAVQDWYHVYLIGKADGSIHLVYSDGSQNQNPWATGPDLSAGTYDFPLNGWVYWKFLGSCRNRQGGTWDIVPGRKVGNHVQWENAHRQFTIGFPSGLTQWSLYNRMPPTSMRVNLMTFQWSETVAIADVFIRTASVGSGAGETALMHDPNTLTDPNAETWKHWNSAGGNSGSGAFRNMTTFWVDTDDYQRIDYWSSWGGAGVAEWALWVLGYEEFVDAEALEATF